MLQVGTATENSEKSYATMSWSFHFVIVSFLYLACVIIFYYPYFPHLTTHLIGPPEDNMQDYWTIWYTTKFLKNFSFNFYSNNLIFYPEGDYLIYHGFSYSNLIPLVSILNLFSLPNNAGVLTASQNITLILSYYLCAIGCYYLAKHYTDNHIASFIAGFIFAFNPSHFAHTQHHFGISTIQYLPFMVLFFVKYLSNKNFTLLAATVFFFCLNALSYWYYAVYAMYYFLFYYFFHAIKERKLLIREIAKPILYILCSSFVLLSPLVIPMVIEGLKNPNVNMASGVDPGIDFFSLFVFDPYHLLHQLALPINLRYVGNFWEMTAYLGLVNIMVILWWILKKRKSLLINGITFQLCGLLFFVLLACGPFLHAMGKELPIPLPTYIAQFIPFLCNARTSSRTIVVAYLFLGITMAMITNRYMASFNDRKGLYISVVLLLLVFADYYPGWAILESTEVKFPKAYDIILQDRSNERFGILDLPLGYEEGTRYMMYQTYHGKPIVTASVARKLRTTLLNKLNMNELSLQKNQLISGKVKYIVIHKDLINTPDAEPLSVSEYAKTYTALYEDDNEILIKVF